jgi:hypothetical protein
MVPEDVPTWGYEGDGWEKVYAHFGMPLPTDRVRLVRGRQIEFLPYFNAGFVAFANAAVHEGKSFGALWKETAKEVDWNCNVGRKRPWLDQVTLPVTLKRFGLEYQVLPASYNFFTPRMKSNRQVKDAHVLHYHRKHSLKDIPKFEGIKAYLFDLIPAHLHDELSAYLTRYSAF